MRFIIITIMLLSGCANQGIRDVGDLYDVRFGIISNPKESFAIDTFTKVIPWEDNRVEPKYVAHITKSAKGSFTVHYQVYSYDPETEEKKLVESSIWWKVEAGAGKGAFLSPDFLDGVQHGVYLFAIYADYNEIPVKVIPFELVKAND